MQTSSVFYVIDKNTKERLAMGTDIRALQALKAAIEYSRPCFIIEVIIGGKVQVA